MGRVVKRVGACLAAALVVAGLMAWPPEGEYSSVDLQLTVPEKEKLLALTFDDGPHPEHTAVLLDALAQRGVKATFFLVGCQVELAPELVERMAAEGHQIGIHTLDHVQVNGLSQRDFERQVEGLRRVLYPLVGERELWLRPPYGIMDDNTLRWADSPVVLWSVDPEDWKDTDVRRIVRHITDRVRDGDIVLLHDIYPSSVEAALQVVDCLQEQGWQFVTVEQLLHLKGRAGENGRVYRAVR
ncbi:MAG: polysaccharide deacetylase family protein [Oscillospiraceae bacterium]|nr:polysaccharide deacetylase family protein [Oscillospiraceae bacterium]